MISTTLESDKLGYDRLRQAAKRTIGRDRIVQDIADYFANRPQDWHLNIHAIVSLIAIDRYSKTDPAKCERIRAASHELWRVVADFPDSEVAR